VDQCATGAGCDQLYCSQRSGRDVIRLHEKVDAHDGDTSEIAVRGARFVTVSDDKTAAVGSADTYVWVAVLGDHVGVVSCVARDLWHSINGCGEATTHVYDAKTVQCFRVLYKRPT
jgi:hypothetical protein